MALIHDFILLNKADVPYAEYGNYIKSDNFDVSIPDDLILYFIDYLNWIPTSNPASSSYTTSLGLNYYGPTVINLDGEEHAVKVFKAITEIFLCAPDQIHLKGSFSYQLADDNIEEKGIERIIEGSAYYEKIVIDRNEITRKFSILAELSQKIIDSNGNLYLLHLGI
jgi:hypothetical protein